MSVHKFLIVFSFTIVLQLQGAFAQINAALQIAPDSIIRVLCSDSLEGRGLGTIGIRRAEDFLCRTFEVLNLQSVDGSFLQPFSYVARARGFPQFGLACTGIMPAAPVC